MAKYLAFAFVGAILLGASIVAFIAGSIPEYSTKSSYLSFSEINVDTIVDAERIYSNSISASVGDKFVFNLTTNDRNVNLDLSVGSTVVFQQSFTSEIDSEIIAPSNGTYRLTIDSPESVAVDGTVTVLRLTTTATSESLYLGLGFVLAIFALVFIFYGVYLNLETEKKKLTTYSRAWRSAHGLRPTLTRAPRALQLLGERASVMYLFLFLL